MAAEPPGPARPGLAGQTLSCSYPTAPASRSSFLRVSHNGVQSALGASHSPPRSPPPPPLCLSPPSFSSPAPRVAAALTSLSRSCVSTACSRIIISDEEKVLGQLPHWALATDLPPHRERNHQKEGRRKRNHQALCNRRPQKDDAPCKTTSTQNPTASSSAVPTTIPVAIPTLAAPPPPTSSVRGQGSPEGTEVMGFNEPGWVVHIQASLTS